MDGEASTEPNGGRPRQALDVKARRRVRWRRFAAVLVVLIGLCAVLVFAAYRYNNRPRMSEAAFADAVARAVERGRGWVRQHPDLLLRQNRNAALFCMLQEMDRLHPTPAFRELVAQCMAEPASPGFWMRLLNPNRRVRAGPMNRALRETTLGNRWLIYALNPEGVRLTPVEERTLFDSERSKRRQLAHQLWAVWQLRRVSGDPRATDRLITRLSERITGESAVDIRVHDLYCERVTFVLMAGHPEMINRRWVERIIENQEQDGGWNDQWYGFSSTPQWGDNPDSNEHTTLLALWALYQVQYGYPEAFGLPASP